MSVGPSANPPLRRDRIRNPAMTRDVMRCERDAGLSLLARECIDGHHSLLQRILHLAVGAPWALPADLTRLRLRHACSGLATVAPLDRLPSGPLFVVCRHHRCDGGLHGILWRRGETA